MNQDFNDFYGNSNSDNEKNDNNNYINNSEMNSNNINKTKDVILNSLSNVLNNKIKDNKLTKKGKTYYKILNIVIILIMILLIIPIIIIAKNMISRNDYTFIPIMLIIIIIIFQVLLLIAFIKLRNTKKGISKGYKIFNNVAPLVIDIFKNKNQDNESSNSNFLNSSINSRDTEEVSDTFNNSNNNINNMEANNDVSKETSNEEQENKFMNYISDKLSKSKTEERELTELEITYNTILKVITIIIIILWTRPLFMFIKLIVSGIVGIIKDPSSVLETFGEGLLAGGKTLGPGVFSLFTHIGSYIISSLIFAIGFYLVIYILLIIFAFRIKKEKQEK